MRKRKLKFMIVFFLSLGLTLLQAQENVNATGGNASGIGGTASYSVGQVVYTTNTGTNGSVSQGIQQSFEITVETGIEEAKGINISVMAYPNPVTDYLQLEVKDFDYSLLSFQLYDINGRLLQNEKITDTQTSIAMSHLASASYFIKVIQENKIVKTFRVIKH